MMPITRESKLEKYIKDFVESRTGECVELQLSDVICIRPVPKRGSTVLGILWANVLQNENNFPKESHCYYNEYDEKAGEEKLMVAVTHVTFAVYLTTGKLTISSDYVYSWFTRHFQDLMAHYDPEFAASWVYSPTQFKSSLTAKEDTAVVTYHMSPTETYLLLRNTTQQQDLAFEKRLNEDIDGLIAGVGDLSVHKSLWEENDLLIQLQDLRAGGLYDSFSYLYKLYRSLLFKWFKQENAKIFISSPKVDAKILKEVVDLFLSSGTCPKGTIEAFYVDFKCDNGKAAIQVKKEAISDYPERIKAYVEYHILRKMIHLSTKVTGTFMAAVCDGKAEVLVAGANLHSDFLHQNRMETATFVTMDESAFVSKYIAPCAAPNVSVTY